MIDWVYINPSKIIQQCVHLNLSHESYCLNLNVSPSNFKVPEWDRSKDCVRIESCGFKSVEISFPAQSCMTVASCKFGIGTRTQIRNQGLKQIWPGPSVFAWKITACPTNNEAWMTGLRICYLPIRTKRYWLSKKTHLVPVHTQQSHHLHFETHCYGETWIASVVSGFGKCPGSLKLWKVEFRSWAPGIEKQQWKGQSKSMLKQTKEHFPALNGK